MIFRRFTAASTRFSRKESTLFHFPAAVYPAFIGLYSIFLPRHGRITLLVRVARVYGAISVENRPRHRRSGAPIRVAPLDTPPTVRRPPPTARRFSRILSGRTTLRLRQTVTRQPWSDGCSEWVSVERSPEIIWPFHGYRCQMHARPRHACHSLAENKLLRGSSVEIQGGQRLSFHSSAATRTKHPSHPCRARKRGDFGRKPSATQTKRRSHTCRATRHALRRCDRGKKKSTTPNIPTHAYQNPFSHAICERCILYYPT